MTDTPLLNSLNPKTRDVLHRHLEFVIEMNKSINLTRIDSFDEGELLHIEDSLAALQEFQAAPTGNYIDLGSGAGFPGIPIGVVTGRNTTLLDARQKKMNVIQDFLTQENLEKQFRTVGLRAELLAKKEPKAYAVASARALSKLSVLMELASPLLMNGGHLICFKALVETDELEHAERVKNKTGMQIVSDRSFTLGENFQRRIIVFEKFKESGVKLPRKEGMAQNDPL